MVELSKKLHNEMKNDKTPGGLIKLWNIFFKLTCTNTRDSMMSTMLLMNYFNLLMRIVLLMVRQVSFFNFYLLG